MTTPTGSNYAIRNYWDWPETVQLIEILEEYQLKNFNSTNHLLSKKFWCETSDQLKAKGIDKNSIQCKVKWKNLKAKFKKNDPSLTPIYHKLEKLIGRCNMNSISPPANPSIPNSPVILPPTIQSPLPNLPPAAPSSPIRAFTPPAAPTEYATLDQFNQLRTEILSLVNQVPNGATQAAQLQIDQLSQSYMSLKQELLATQNELKSVKRELIQFNELILKNEQVKMNLILKMLNLK